jgi:hypothetical protein
MGRHQVSFTDGSQDTDPDIGECLSEGSIKRLEPRGSDDRRRQAVERCRGRHQPIDGGFVTGIPYLLKPRRYDPAIRVVHDVPFGWSEVGNAVSSTRQHGNELDAPPVPLKQVIDKVTDDQIRFTGTLVHDPARQHFRWRAPLDVDRTATAFRPAPQFGPAGRTAGLALEQDFKLPGVELRIVRNRVAQAWARSADYLDECLQLRSPVIRLDLST